MLLKNTELQIVLFREKLHGISATLLFLKDECVHCHKSVWCFIIIDKDTSSSEDYSLLSFA